MFTGLVECLGRVADVRRKRGAVRLAIASELPLDELRDGESVAVDGVCLTVADRGRGAFHADVVAETLERTTLGALRAGDAVHLERALRAGDRLGGHLVQGHVDGTAEVEWLRGRGGERRLRVRLPQPLTPYVALKGSIALHGVSLTVAALDERGVEIALVPHTLECTKLGRVRPGSRLNVEVDLLARYLERLLGPRR